MVFVLLGIYSYLPWLSHNSFISKPICINMRFNWISLKNIRSYLHEKITFSSGVTLLAGDIGSGKSTVLLSIEFALFGLIKGELLGSSLLRNGASEGSVTLAFSVGKDDVVITRVLKRKQHSIVQESSYITINGVKKEASPVELKAHVLTLLGYPAELLTKKNLIYRFTVYTPQEEMKRILLESADDRLDTLRKAFGIDRYKRVKENAMLVVKELKGQCKTLEGAIEDIPGQEQHREVLQKKRKELEAAYAPLQVRQTAMTQEIAQFQEAYASLRDKLTDFYEEKSAFSRYDSALETVLSQLEGVTRTLTETEKNLAAMQHDPIDLKQREIIKEQLDQAEKYLEQLRDKRSTSEQQRLHATKQVEDAMKLITELTSSIKEKEASTKVLAGCTEKLATKQALQRNLEKKRTELLDAEKHRATVSEKYDASKDVVATITHLDDCPTCHQHVDHEHKHVIVTQEQRKQQEYVSQLKNIDQTITALTEGIARFEEKIAALEKVEQEARQHERKLDQIALHEQELLRQQQSLEAAQQQLKTLPVIAADSVMKAEANLQELRKTYNRIIEALSQDKLRQERQQQHSRLKLEQEALRKKVAELTAEKEKALKRLMSFGDIEAKRKQHEKKLEELRDALAQVERSMTEQHAYMKSTDDELVRVADILKGRYEQRKNLSTKRQYIEWLEHAFIPVTGIIEKHILNSVYHEFNALFMEWFSMLIEDDLITARLDDRFTPVIQQNGYDHDVINLSGGEKTALALAYRLALNKVINDISAGIATRDVIILDEPTDGFSDQQLDRVRDVLEHLAMSQVIIVSHEEKIASMVDHLVRIAKREHVSSVL